MRIVLHTYEATRKRKSGLENHAVQLINTLKGHYSLEAIVQTNRRAPLYKQPALNKYLKPIAHVKILMPFLKGLFYKNTNHLFKEIDTDTHSKNYPSMPLNSVYQNFKKLHVTSSFYDMIKFNYWITKRKNLIEIPTMNDVDILWLTSPFPMYMKDKINICSVHDTFFKSVKPMSENHINTTQKKLKQILETFDLIFTMSEYTKDQIIQTFPTVDVNKIQVSYQSIPEKNFLIPSAKQRSRFLQKHGLESKKFLLHVGSLIPRKNQIKLIKAFLKSNLDTCLVMVGKKTKYASKTLLNLIEANSANIMWLNHVQDEELNILYQEASVLIFPSLYEGFGLPILEAFYHHCPVITSNTSAIPEIAGDAVVYVNPEDIDDISRGIKSLVNNYELQKKLIQLGQTQLAKFSDQDILKRINDGINILTQSKSLNGISHA